MQLLRCCCVLVLLLGLTMAMNEPYCDRRRDCLGSNALCIKNKCICIKSSKWDDDAPDCNQGSSTENNIPDGQEDEVVKVHVTQNKKIPISLYNSASFFASYTFIISCVIISIFTCYLKILAVRRWQMRLREIRHINNYV